MAKITGSTAAAGSSIGTVDTAVTAELGTIVQGVDDFGNAAEFIYLAGCASTIVGSVVTYDEAGATTLIVASAIGPVAVALAITDSTSEYGWYGITGTFYVDMVANTSDNNFLGRETTNGKVGDGFATGDMILGMISRGATTSAALAYAQLSRPWASDAVGA